MDNKKILITDYSDTCSRLSGEYLINLGIPQENIVIINDGREALERAMKELFDIIIINPCRLGMDAVEMINQIKTRYNGKSPKIIEYTAGVIGHQRNEAFDAVIFKPTDQETFSKKIYDVLNS